MGERDELVTRAETARRIGASVRSVDRLIATGRIAAVRIPCVGVRIAASEIDRLIGAASEAA